LGRSSAVALLPAEAGREETGVSGLVVMRLWGVVASGAMGGRGEGVCLRRTEPIMESGIWARKAPLQVGDDGVCGGERSRPCLWAVSAVMSMSSIVPATGHGSTCWDKSQHTKKTWRKQEGSGCTSHGAREMTELALCVEGWGTVPLRRTNARRG
jgi:hypothetical protein